MCRLKIYHKKYEKKQLKQKVTQKQISPVKKEEDPSKEDSLHLKNATSGEDVPVGE